MHYVRICFQHPKQRNIYGCSHRFNGEFTHLWYRNEQEMCKIMKNRVLHRVLGSLELS
jgi:hypothetical protein